MLDTSQVEWDTRAFLPVDGPHIGAWVLLEADFGAFFVMSFLSLMFFVPHVPALGTMDKKKNGPAPPSRAGHCLAIIRIFDTQQR